MKTGGPKTEPCGTPYYFMGLELLDESLQSKY